MGHFYFAGLRRRKSCQTGLILEKNNMGDEEQLTQYSLEEVEKHNVGRGPDKSIWMVIHDKVFDVTKFLDEHPGGEEILIETAGKDASEAFEDVGHSTDAREMMEEYFLGDVREEDRIGSVDTGPKSWATGTSTTQNEESGWISWLFPIALALGASAFYRFYFVK